MTYTAAEVVEQLKTRRDAIVDELAALTSTAAGGKPNSSGLTGVDHIGYKKSLYDELAMIEQQLAANQDFFEVVIEVDT